jgi:hypothetical protein
MFYDRYNILISPRRGKVGYRICFILDILFCDFLTQRTDDLSGKNLILESFIGGLDTTLVRSLSIYLYQPSLRKGQGSELPCEPHQILHGQLDRHDE